MAIAGLSNFVNLLFTFGMKAKDIKEYEEDAKEQLSKGNLPWDLETGPITDRCVIDALRQYKNPQSSKKIVVKEVSASKGFFYRKYMSVDMIRALSLTNKYWLQAKELLEKHRPEQFSKYEERWNQRTAEIIRKDVENFGLNSQ